jgi:hypothetical protein
VHAHPQEKTGRFLKGRIILSIGDEKMEMNPGDCWSVPGNLEHGADILGESIAIEVFSPVRKDYLNYYHPGENITGTTNQHHPRTGLVVFVPGRQERIKPYHPG